MGSGAGDAWIHVANPNPWCVLAFLGSDVGLFPILRALGITMELEQLKEGP